MAAAPPPPAGAPRSRLVGRTIRRRGRGRGVGLRRCRAMACARGTSSASTSPRRRLLGRGRGVGPQQQPPEGARRADARASRAGSSHDRLGRDSVLRRHRGGGVMRHRRRLPAPRRQVARPAGSRVPGSSASGPRGRWPSSSPAGPRASSVPGSRGGASCTMRYMADRTLSEVSYGGRPVRAWYSVAPSDQTSLASVAGWPEATSGARYAGEPDTTTGRGHRRVARPGDAEVRQLRRALVGHQHVGGLDVAVDDARRVRGGQRLRRPGPAAPPPRPAAGRRRARPARRGRRRRRAPSPATARPAR